MLKVRGYWTGHELSMSAYRLPERHRAWGSQAAWLALIQMMKMRTSWLAAGQLLLSTLLRWRRGRSGLQYMQAVITVGLT